MHDCAEQHDSIAWIATAAESLIWTPNCDLAPLQLTEHGLPGAIHAAGYGRARDQRVRADEHEAHVRVRQRRRRFRRTVGEETDLLEYGRLR